MFLKRNIFLFIILSLTLALDGVFSFSNEKIARVRFVYDGDTILLSSGEKVRYLGIDAPELDPEGKRHEFMALQARRFNINMVKGKLVRLEFDREKRDRYGRLLAYVYLVETGQMVNVLLLKNGLAHVLLKEPNLKYRRLFIKMQREAMKRKIGIWSRPFKNEERYYIGNKRSFIFHRPDCPFGKRMRPKNKIIFKNCYQAFWAGYSPCRRCKPATYK
jgi:endonuclease YncB( thermonuclease family)